MWHVVIDNHFVELIVALAGGEHHCARMFQHGDDEGHDEGLGEEVFGGAEQAWTLPVPAVLVCLVVASMTLPKGDVVSFQPLFGCVRT